MSMRWKGNSLSNSTDKFSAFVYRNDKKKYRAVIAFWDYFFYWSEKHYDKKVDAKADLEKAWTEFKKRMEGIGV